MRDNIFNLPNQVNLLYQILSNAEGKINRDFHELELSQSGKFLPERFADKLHELVLDQTINKAQYLLPDYGITTPTQTLVESKNGKMILLNLLPETNNILRSIPFYSCSASIISEDKIIAALVTSQNLNYLFWAITGKAQQQNFKLKASQNNDISKANYIDEAEANSLNFASNNLSLLFLAAGKLDYIKINVAELKTVQAALFIAEQAGIKYSYAAESKILTAANSNIFEQIN